MTDHPHLTVAEREMLALAERATPSPELMRYDHGGGRALVDDKPRKLVADYYHEEDREFYHACREAVPSLIATIDKQRAQLAAIRSICSEMTNNSTGDTAAGWAQRIEAVMEGKAP